MNLKGSKRGEEMKGEVKRMEMTMWWPNNERQLKIKLKMSSPLSVIDWKNTNNMKSSH